MSLLCAEAPNVFDLLKDAGINVLWHPSVSIETGAEVRRLLERIESGEIPLDLVCIEGSIVTGPKGTGRYHMLAGTGPPDAGLGAQACPARARRAGCRYLRGLWRGNLGRGQPCGRGRAGL